MSASILASRGVASLGRIALYAVFWMFLFFPRLSMKR